MVRIERYNNSKKETWDDFVTSSKNGTFLFCRDYMDYHADRFIDYSFMFYKNNKLLAVLPANADNDILFSHQGLTYGGFILSKDLKLKDLLVFSSEFLRVLKELSFIKFIYKCIPYIYHKQFADEDLYMLFKQSFTLSGRQVSSAMYLNDKIPFSENKIRNIKRLASDEFLFKASDDWQLFWDILENNLKTKYNTKPTHTLAEILLLKNKFPQNILLYGLYDLNGELASACVLYLTDKVLHLQYIASSFKYNELNVNDLLMSYVLDLDLAPIFDYGISTESQGKILNENLLQHKEGFGLRAVMYDIYSLDLS